MEHLRDGIGLRGYGQRDPKQEYKKEGYDLFVTMVARTSATVVSRTLTAEVRKPEDEREAEMRELMRHAEALRMSVAKHDDALPPGAHDQPDPEPEAEALISSEMECPCGSGKPFSSCHGAGDEEDSGSSESKEASV